MKQVGVIGAGAGGLCSLKHALAEEEFSVVAWEHSAAVGGTWIYTPKTGLDEHGFPIHSSMYNSLKTNLPKEIMAFPDFPFKEGERSYIHHTDVLQYLNEYADHFALRKYIKFNHHVEWVEPIERPDGPPGWKVTVKNLVEGTATDVECDVLFVCNGHYSIPKIPEIKNISSFKGEQMHSHNYRVPEPFLNLRVIILGASASGMDISLEVSKVAKEVYLSHNFPVPIPSKLPANLHQVKGIKEARSNGYVLMDDSFVEVDALIYCTGYEYTFPFLSPACKVTIEDNQVKPLYKHVVHSIYPSMGFIGIPFQICPFPIFDVQVRYFLAMALGRVPLPPATPFLNPPIREGTPKRHYHQLGSEQWSYTKDLAHEAKMDPLNPYYKEGWDVTFWRRIFALTEYKNFTYSHEESGDEGNTRLVERLNGQVTNTTTDLLRISVYRTAVLLLFNLREVLRLIMSSGLKRVRGIFRLHDSI